MLPFLGGMMLAGEDGPLTVWNPSDNTGAPPTFSADRATMRDQDFDGGAHGARGVNPRSAGKWCFDVRYGGTVNNSTIIYSGLAVASSSISGGVGGANTSSAIHRGGASQGGAVLYGNTQYGVFDIANGTVATWLVDLDGGTLRVASDGVLIGTSIPIGTGRAWLPYGSVSNLGALTIGGATYVPAGFSPWI